MSVMIRFERGRDDVVGPTFGPYDYLQVTYGTLRISPNGDDLAYLHEDGDWHLSNPRGTDEGYSDFIIFHG